jgi:hypothetical protein
VNPNVSTPWTAETLVSLLQDTLALTRMRMQPQTALSAGGLLPMVLLGQRAGGAGISFSV